MKCRKWAWLTPSNLGKRQKEGEIDHNKIYCVNKINTLLSNFDLELVDLKEDICHKESVSGQNITICMGIWVKSPTFLLAYLQLAILKCSFESIPEDTITQNCHGPWDIWKRYIVIVQHKVFFFGSGVDEDLKLSFLFAFDQWTD